jgi:tetratricopeptide (TPR) repeat protein
VLRGRRISLLTRSLRTRSSPARPVTLALAVAGLALAPAGVARAGDFWAEVIDPDRELVEGLVARARASLDRGIPGGVRRESAARAEALLDEALARKPGHFQARFLRGDALAIAGRLPEALREIAAACALAATPEDEASCTLRLAVEQSRAGRLEQALGTYDRHLRLGLPSSMVQGNSAEILMALGRLPEAIDRYRQAVELEARRDPGHERDAALALALYGLGAALDRDEQAAAAAEAMARAVALDPKLELLALPGAEGGGGDDIFFVPAADIHYYRALAARALGQGEAARASFTRFVAEAPRSPYLARARAHLRVAAAAAPDGGVPTTPEPTRREPQRRWRLVAAATVETEGPMPAPLLDAVWKGQRRLFEPCFEEAPALPSPTLRLSIDLRFDGRGVLTKVQAKAPPEWPDTPACLEQRLRGVKYPRPSRPDPTTARLELVLSMVGKS